MKLGDLPGLPEKKSTPFKQYLNWDADVEQQRDISLVDGFNACKSEYDSLNLTLDVPYMAERLYEKFSKGHKHVPWIELEDGAQKDFFISLAQDISENAARVMKVTKNA